MLVAVAPIAEPEPCAQLILAAPVGLLDYRVPPALRDSLRPGMGVTVALGPRRTGAYVVRLHREPAPEGVVLKDILAADPERLALPPAVLELVLFAAAYYRASPGEVLAAALPRMARSGALRYALSAAGHACRAGTACPLTGTAGRPLGPALQAALQGAPAAGFTSIGLAQALGVSRQVAGQRVRALRQLGLVEAAAPRAPRHRVWVFCRRPGATDAALPPRQRGARALFAQLPPPTAPLTMAELEVFHPGARRCMATLLQHDLAERQQRAVAHLAYPGAMAEFEEPVKLTADQQTALQAVCADVDRQAFAAHLLHGVTGSGKTEVYLRAIAHVLQQGRQALVLVPEIALTPQLGERFRRRFGDAVATFHSGLTEAERRDEWERVQRGDATIGLGARSALFLPLTALGIVIVDEEHETSFKQDETPRYNARDLAVWRARNAAAVVVLGSATPSLETHHNAQLGRYRRLSLPSRVAGRPLPEVSLIDLANHPRAGEGVFTEPLLRRLEHTLRQDEQVILFLNRRGFAPYVFCRDCGHSYRCASCDVSLTLHQRRGQLCCHYCGFETAAPDTCEACQSHRVGAQGLGTEKVQAEVHGLFPQAQTLRLDRDVVRNKGDLEQLLTRFRRREAQILIGTQMVAKGHDFPGVTLVGVLAADGSLNFPDFRAAERTFQLLTQVAGRAGRGTRKGEVWVQAYETEHYAIDAALTHDYERFVGLELQARRELGYPPYTHLALLRYEGAVEAATKEAATDAAGTLRAQVATAGLAVTVLGPAPAPLSRLRDLYRFQVLLKAHDRGGLRQVLSMLGGPRRRGVRQVLDVDPVHML